MSDTPETHHRISIVANAVATAATFCIDSFNSYRGPHFFSSLGFVRNLLFPHRTVTPLHLRNMQQSMCILTYCILQTETSIYDVAARLRKLCGVWVCWTCGVYGEWRLEECLLVAKLARQFYSLYQLAFISRCISLHTISLSSIFFCFFLTFSMNLPLLAWKRISIWFAVSVYQKFSASTFKFMCRVSKKQCA